MGYVGKTNIKFSDLNNIRVEKSKTGEWAEDTQASMGALRSWFKLNTKNTDDSLPTTDADISLTDFAGHSVQKIEMQVIPETNDYYDNSGDGKVRLKFIGSPHTEFGSTIKITGGGAPSTLANISVANTTTGWTVGTGLGNTEKWTRAQSNRVLVSTTDSTSKVLSDFDFYLNVGSDGVSTSSGTDGSFISADSGGTPATASGTGANGIDYQIVSNNPGGGDGAFVTGVEVVDTFEGTPLYKYDPGQLTGGRIDVVATLRLDAAGALGTSNQLVDSHGNAFTTEDHRSIWNQFVTTNKGSIANRVFQSNAISGSTWSGTINDTSSVSLETHHGCTFIKYKLNSPISTGVFPNGGAAIALYGSQIGAWWKKSSSNPPADFKTSWGAQYKTGNNSAYVIHGNTRSKWWGYNSGGTTGTVTEDTVTGMPAFGNTDGIMTTDDDYLWIHADNSHGGGGNGYLSIITSIAAQATFIVPDDVSKISVLLAAGGGGGSGGYTNGGNGGAGGGGGGVINFSELTVAPGDNIFIDVGYRGTGGIGTTGVYQPGTAGMSSRITHSTTAAPRGNTLWVTGGLCSNLQSETTGGLPGTGGGGSAGGNGYFDGGLSKGGAGGDVTIDQAKAAAAGDSTLSITLKNANGGGTPCSGSGSYGGNPGYGSGGTECNWSGTGHGGNKEGLYGGGGAGATGSAGDGGDGVCFLAVDTTPTAGGLETLQNLVNDWNTANPTNSMTVTTGGAATIPDGTVVELTGSTTSNAVKTWFKWANRTTSTRSVYSKSIIALNSPHGPESTNQPQYTST